MTEHTITIDGARYRFELHSHAHGPKVMVEAPGLAPFDVEEPDALGKARDALRSALSRRAREDES